ncbi:biliverdin-producing heme oxygenase [Capsulimonas corticalis]|uniref:Biliverdin-producing heme oxygenase n=1 Tax=Capsulimonas corticalis TaxID=2219043 RepID=A0A402CV83_9BACT|nr:biliverdin-producing heme oxygenase [Capsulimonas corticalis]BDI30312.1 biliverdin-producing heme oxygenase [Capsulimonas corticalis]
MSIELLRRETRQDHQRLEDRLDIHARCATARSYRRLLERFHGFYAPYEAALKRSASLLPDSLHWESRVRLPRLIDDLAAMGVPARQCERLARCPGAPRPETRAEILGCLYVTEGSTLGGQIIRRRIHEMYGSEAPPTAFFEGYGARTGSHWRALCAAIDGALLSPTEQEAMTRVAQGVFRTLETWLCDESPHEEFDA